MFGFVNDELSLEKDDIPKSLLPINYCSTFCKVESFDYFEPRDYYANKDVNSYWLDYTMFYLYISNFV